MNEATYFWLLVGMGLVTYLPRVLPLVFLSRRRLPRWAVEWLDLIPVAILSALVAPALCTAGVPRAVSLWRPEVLAAAPTFWFAVKTRSLGGTVLVGMALFWLAEKLF